MSESHIVVVWPKARHLLDLVLELVDASTQVKQVTEIHWSENLIDKNYDRFYTRRILGPYRTSLIHDKGVGPVVVISVLDSNPVYGSRRAMGGEQWVNTTLFDIKAEIRSRIGGLPGIHSSDNPTKAAHEYMLLTGEHLLGESSPDWDGGIGILRKDTHGLLGWRSLEELADALSVTNPHVVMHPPAGSSGVLLDILSASPISQIAMLNAIPKTRVVSRRYGGQHSVAVAEINRRVIIRSIEDGYYPAGLARELLDSPTLSVDGFWVPRDTNRYMALLYSGLMHSASIPPAIHRELAELSVHLDDPRLDLADDDDKAARLLSDHLQAEGWGITRPIDRSTYFNHHRAETTWPWAAQILDQIVGRITYLGNRWVKRPLQVTVRSLRERFLELTPALRTWFRRRRAAE